MCVFGAENAEKRLRFVKSHIIRNAKKKLDEIKVTDIDISRLPVEPDDSVQFIRWPDIAAFNGRICGLVLSLASGWYGQEEEDYAAVDAVLIAVMDLRHVITPDLPESMIILKKRVADRNKTLFRKR